MSGGRWDYRQERLADELYGYNISIDYGERGHRLSKIARRLNPLKDREISELVWDVLCLIESCDWMQSGDTCEETYNNDVKWFKNKWFKRTSKDVVEAYKTDLLDYAKELQNEFDKQLTEIEDSSNAD